MLYTACLTGHRPQSLSCKFDEEHPSCIKIKNQLKRMIVGLIEKKNVTHFISGAALGIDLWAMEIVLDLKEEYPNITLEAAVPCRAHTTGWNVKNKERYDRMLARCNKISLLQEQYTSDCIMKRNRYMVDNSNYVVAVWNGKWNGIYNTIKYAIQKGKSVYCIDSVNFRMKAICPQGA